MHAIISSEKFCFEMLYLENECCLVYSIVIQGNSVGILFNGLLAKLPAILDGFFTSTTSEYMGWLGATKWQGKHTLCSYTCFMDPLVLEMAQKVVKSSLPDRVRTYNLVAFCLTASRED